MKPFFLSFLIAISISQVVSAQHNPTQNGTAKPSFSVDKIVPPSQLSGNNNYLLSLNKKDFSTRSYVFYTDSNATIAHISINGTSLRLTGGLNAENSMSYNCKDYTVTLNDINKSASQGGNTDGNPNRVEIATSLIIYTNTTVIGEKLVGVEIKQGNK